MGFAIGKWNVEVNRGTKIQKKVLAGVEFGLLLRTPGVSNLHKILYLSGVDSNFTGT